jgi:hypothetical protein
MRDLLGRAVAKHHGDFLKFDMFIFVKKGF